MTLHRWLPAAVGALLLAAAPAFAQAGHGAIGRTGLTDIPDVRVGHHAMPGGRSGCTVVLFDSAGAVGGVSQRGAAPGTRETDLLDPLNMVERVNAVVLTGGSAYGLDAAQGVMRYLEERNIGFRTGAGVVPIVPAAVIFDLPFANDRKARPNAECGYRAASGASAAPVPEGNAGAGLGATVGKLGFFFDAPRADDRLVPMKGGLGSASIALPSGLVVSALVVVNAVGDVIDPQSGRVVAGARAMTGGLADVRTLLRSGRLGGAPRAGENTTLGVVVTNARLTKAQTARVALMADDGLARAIAPSHTEGDGDTMFAFATGSWTGEASTTLIGALAADVVAEAIVRAVVRADSLGGLASARQTGSIPARYR